MRKNYNNEMLDKIKQMKLAGLIPSRDVSILIGNGIPSSGLTSFLAHYNIFPVRVSRGKESIRDMLFWDEKALKAINWNSALNPVQKPTENNSVKTDWNDPSNLKKWVAVIQKKVDKHDNKLEELEDLFTKDISLYNKEVDDYNLILKDYNNTISLIEKMQKQIDILLEFKAQFD